MNVALAAVLLAASLSAAQWSADIDYLAAELPKRHPNPFTHTTREAFNAQLASIKGQVADLSDVEIAIKLQQAVASLRDGHTELATTVEPATYFPLRLYAFPDGIYVTKTNDQSRGACGAKLMAIDGVSVDEVYARVATTISAENDQWLRARVPEAMTRAEVLKTVGVTSSGEARFTFERFELTLHAGPAGTVQALDKTTAELPLYRRNPELRYWYAWIPEQRLLYIKYNACSNDPARPFSTLEREVLAIADAETVDAFVIDLRDNTGGSTEVARGLINGLAARQRLRGRVFAIIGRRTFSSAMFNAVDLKKAGATLAGEATGGKPNAYGEVKVFSLPNSKLTVYHSTRLFTIVPGDPASLEPDLEVEVTANDFFRRRDPVLDAIIAKPAAVLATVGRRRAVAVGPVCPQ